MANVAVLKHQFNPSKPSGMPDEWPFQVKELGDGTDLPGENWVLMTVTAYKNHLDTHREAFELWRSGVGTAPQLIEKKRCETCAGVFASIDEAASHLQSSGHTTCVSISSLP